jgi:hypothetical protein
MTGNDDGTKTCRIDVLIEEHDERTRAKARLDPADEPVTQIGDELSIARALSDLANQLFALASTDIQASTDEPVTGLHH